VFGYKTLVVPPSGIAFALWAEIYFKLIKSRLFGSRFAGLIKLPLLSFNIQQPTMDIKEHPTSASAVPDFSLRHYGPTKTARQVERSTFNIE
jgi:hypothetical protein